MRGNRRRWRAGGATAVCLAAILTAGTGPTVAGTGWEAGGLLVPTGTAEERRPQVAVDSEGDRHVVWDDSNGHVWIAEAESGGTTAAPVRLFASDGANGGGYPRIAIDVEDRITVVWYVTDPSHERRSHVEARTVSPTGQLGATQVLSDLDENAYYPEVAVDSEGVATVVWENQVGGGWPGRIEAVRLAPGTGTPEGPVMTLDDPGGEVPDGIGVVDATLAMGPDDRAVVAWTRFDGAAEGSSRHATVRAVRLGPEGTPGEVEPVSDDPTLDFRYPAIAVAPDGTTTIVTTRFGSTAATVATRFSATDFEPGAPSAVSDPQQNSWDDPTVAVDGLGRVTVAWWAAGPDGTVLRTRRLGPDGELEEPRSALGLQAGIFARMELVAMAADADGRVMVAWPGADGRGPRMHAVRIGKGGQPSTTQRLSSPGDASSFGEVVDLTIDVRGRASVVWSRYGAVAVRRSLAPDVGRVPADTTILRGPGDGKVVRDRTPRFVFEAGTVEATLQCRVDGRRWKKCSSPFVTPRLADGRHRFRVRAVDADGARPDPTPAVARFRVDR